MKVPFNRPSFTGNELDYISKAVLSGKISGDGVYTEKCHRLLKKKLNAVEVMLTSSCTHAMELAAMLLNLKAGDQVLAPAYTFPSTVNAFMLRGAEPVFVDIRPDTKNINEEEIEAKITKETKAIFVVHYAGVACEMDKIKAIAAKHRIPIVEDAAQGVNAKYKDHYLGTLGTFGAFSFHETKNVMAGEGGAILINDQRDVERAEILREKGTDRSKFFRGEVDKYTWRDIGSSYLPSDVLAAFLFAQLEAMDEINRTRKHLYDTYYSALKGYEKKGVIHLPVIPGECSSNYHMFYLMLRTEEEREKLRKSLLNDGILAVFHYLPLHLSEMGKKLGYRQGQLPVTESVSARLLRLPLYNDMSENEQAYVIDAVQKALNKI